MGCASSKDDGEADSPNPRRRNPRFMSRLTPSATDMRLVHSLQALKKQMDAEGLLEDSLSFTKIVLKLGTIERIMKRIKAVFRSVDEGNKGHVTKDELKQGLQRARVDLDDEWKDTNIDECLENLGGGEVSDDADEVGLREFVVMLAVGRVCRPRKRRSTVFAPMQSNPEHMSTIEEDEARKSGDQAVERHVLSVINDGNTTIGDDVVAEPKTSGEQVEGGIRFKSAADAVRAGAEGRVLASAGPGGLPSRNSWNKVKWTRIPSLKQIDISGASGRSTSKSQRGKSAAREAAAAESVQYVLDLFIAAYFTFDTKGHGYISRKYLEKVLRKSERESGASPLLDEKRWSELAWDGDRLSFQEFIYAFAQWLGLMEDEDDTLSIWSPSTRPSGRRTSNPIVKGDSAAAAANAAAVAGTSASGAVAADCVVGKADVMSAGHAEGPVDSPGSTGSVNASRSSSLAEYLESGPYSEFDASCSSVKLGYPSPAMATNDTGNSVLPKVSEERELQANSSSFSADAGRSRRNFSASTSRTTAAETPLFIGIEERTAMDLLRARAPSRDSEVGVG